MVWAFYAPNYGYLGTLLGKVPADVAFRADSCDENRPGDGFSLPESRKSP